MLWGADGVGRGNIAGLNVWGVVGIPDKSLFPVKDSKKTNKKQRIKIARSIKENYAYALGCATPEEIDRIGINQAEKLALQRAIAYLQEQGYEIDIVHGDLGMPSLDLIPVKKSKDADANIDAVSAASILAKTELDNYYCRVHEHYPKYGFDKHNGYATKQHKEILSILGLSPIHRKSYKPCQNLQLSIYFPELAEPQSPQKNSASPTKDFAKLTPKAGQSLPRTSQVSPSTTTSVLTKESKPTATGYPSPAKEQAWQEKEKDLRTSNPPYGGKLTESSRQSAQNSSSSNNQTGFAIEGWRKSSTPLPKSGTMRNGVVYPQASSVRHTKGKGSLSLPTPTTYGGTKAIGKAGRIKLETTFRGKEAIAPTESMNPAVSGWMMGFPPGWTESVLMDGGEKILHRQAQESPEKESKEEEIAPHSTVFQFAPNKRKSRLNEFLSLRGFSIGMRVREIPTNFKGIVCEVGQGCYRVKFYKGETRWVLIENLQFPPPPEEKEKQRTTSTEEACGTLYPCFYPPGHKKEGQLKEWRYSCKIIDSGNKNKAKYKTICKSLKKSTVELVRAAIAACQPPEFILSLI